MREWIWTPFQCGQPSNSHREGQGQNQLGHFTQFLMTYLKIITMYIFIATTEYYYKREIFPILGFKHDFQLVVLIYIW